MKLIGGRKRRKKVAAPPAARSGKFRIAEGVKASYHPDGIAILGVSTGQVFVANRIAADTWNGIVAGKSLEETALKLSSDYGRPAEEVQKDVKDLAVELERHGLIERLGQTDEQAVKVRSIEVLWELLRYDFLMALFGFRRVYRGLKETRVVGTGAADGVQELLLAIGKACRFYWKPVKCLQGSIAVARVLRKRGIPAEVVIGYRPIPFFSHAWVEVEGRVVNDFQTYAERLLVLDRA